MSLREANKIPRYWPEFEQAFLKEFLPENELERAWEAWDKCEMGRNTLNQYISNYREAVLKLKGIDEFQKIRGFVRDLKDTYKVDVKRNSPKTFEEAIKFAQIYDDTTEKS